ncbi:MAG: hypothetical protein SW833_22905 [Cyanobacteriota bacterium]|nr:hypothetical protein [Cyanobacteriota bacterium]
MAFFYKVEIPLNQEKPRGANLRLDPVCVPKASPAKTFRKPLPTKPLAPSPNPTLQL